MKKQKENPCKASIKYAVKDTLEQKQKKQYLDSEEVKEMVAINANVTQKGATNISVTYAQMEAVHSLIQIKNQAFFKRLKIYESCFSH